MSREPIISDRERQFNERFKERAKPITEKKEMGLLTKEEYLKELQQLRHKMFSEDNGNVDGY